MPSLFFFQRAINFIYLSNIIKKKEDSAVSPVIGVILMIAITVILASVITFFVFSFGGMDAKGPVASIRVLNNVNTGGIYDLIIVHGGGESFKGGDWKISIVKIPDPPEFVTATSDFQVGDQIITTNLTNSGTVTVTNRSITSTSPTSLEPGQKYDVKVIVFPYKTMTVDAVIMVR